MNRRTRAHLDISNGLALPPNDAPNEAWRALHDFRRAVGARLAAALVPDVSLQPPPVVAEELVGSGDGFTDGVNAYVSDGDLYNWRHAGLVMDANVTGGHCLERPKVVRCPATGRYVLWVAAACRSAGSGILTGYQS